MQTEVDSRLRAAPIALSGEELDAWARDRANAAATAMLESFHVDIDNGAVWLGNRRVLILQAQWFLDLRQTLIDALGHEGARAVLTRLGYAAGVRDADLSMKQHPDFETAELITTGAAFHALQGSAKAVRRRVELDDPHDRRHQGARRVRPAGGVRARSGHTRRSDRGDDRAASSEWARPPRR